jgi:hypothetical protein
MNVIGIDPGAKESGFVVYDPILEVIVAKDIVMNVFVHQAIENQKGLADTVVIEQLRGYGLRVGNDTFDSIWWSGRFAEAGVRHGMEVYMMPRKDICKAICDNGNAGDKGVRDALIDMFGDPGSKKEPGKLYGIKTHMWPALAACVAYSRGEK